MAINAPILAHALTAARDRFRRSPCFCRNAPRPCVILTASWTNQHRKCMNCRQGHENILWWQAKAPSQSAHYAYRPASRPLAPPISPLQHPRIAGPGLIRKKSRILMNITAGVIVRLRTKYQMVPHRRPDGSCPYEEYARDVYYSGRKVERCVAVATRPSSHLLFLERPSRAICPAEWLSQEVG